jgi:hypothetical protein
MPYLTATSNFQSFSNCKLIAAQVPHVHTQGQAQIGLLKKSPQCCGPIKRFNFVVQKANDIFKPIAVTVFPEYFIWPALASVTCISPTFR